MTHEIQDITISSKYVDGVVQSVNIRLDSWDDDSNVIEPDSVFMEYPIVNGVIPTTIDIIEYIGEYSSQDITEYEMYILTQLLTIENQIEMSANPYIDIANPIVQSISKSGNTVCIRFDVETIPLILYDSIYEFVCFDIRHIQPKFHDKEAFELKLQQSIKDFVNITVSLNF